MGAKKILIFAPYGTWKVHHQLDGVLGCALQQRGCEVQVLTCDEIFENCPNAGKPPTPKKCTECRQSGVNWFANFGLSHLDLGKFLSNQDRQDAQEWAHRLDPKEFSSALFESMPVGASIQGNLHGYFLTGNLDLTRPDVIAMSRSFLRNGALLTRAARRAIREFQPHHALCYNAVLAHYRIFFEACQESGIPVLVHERGLVNDSFLLLDSQHSYSRTGRYQIWRRHWEEVPLTLSECTQVQSYFEERELGKNTNRPAMYTYAMRSESVRNTLRLTQGSKVVGLFTSGDWEVGISQSQIRSTFATQKEWILKTVRICKEQGHTLVIRHHPNNGRDHGKGVAFIRDMIRLNAELEEHVRVIMPNERLTSYALLAHVDVAVSFMTTFAAEAAIRGIPTLCVSQSMYKEMGMEWVQCLEDYAPALERALHRTPDQARRDFRRAYRYAQFLYFRMSYHFRSFGIKNVYESDLRFGGPADLAPGRDAVLDQVCKHILAAAPLHPIPGLRPESAEAEENIFIDQTMNSIEARYRDVRVQAGSDPSRAEVLLLRPETSNLPGRPSWDQMLRRSRHRYLVVTRMPSSPVEAPRSLIQKLYAAAQTSTAEFICLTADNILPDESMYQTAVDFLTQRDHAAAEGVVFGGWICRQDATIEGTCFNQQPHFISFAAAIKCCVNFEDPRQLLACAVVRRSTWVRYFESLAEGEFEYLSDVGRRIFQDWFTDEKRFHRVPGPLLVVFPIGEPQADPAEMGLLYRMTGQLELALKSYTEALDHHPEDPELTRAYEELMRACGRAEAVDRPEVVSADFSPAPGREIEAGAATKSDVIQSYREVHTRVDSVKGWLVPGQEEFLFNMVKSLPDDAVILEMGCNHGRSTCAMAFACLGTHRRIFSIDTFAGNDGIMGRSQDFQSVWSGHLERLGLQNIATPLRGNTYEILSHWGEAYPKVDFVFIDASHEYIDVLKDFRDIYPHVKTGGWVAFHDVEPGWPGPWRVWQEFGRSLLTHHQICSTLACGRKSEEKPFCRSGSEFAFSRNWVEELQRDHSGNEIVAALRQSLGFSTAAAPEREAIYSVEKKITRLPSPFRDTLGQMLGKDARLDGYLHFWNGLMFLGQNRRSEAREAFREAVRVSYPVPSVQVLPHWRDLEETVELLWAHPSMPAGGEGIAADIQDARPESDHYGAKYFEWQKSIGAFGGVANIFKFEEFAGEQRTLLDFGCGGGYLLKNLPARRKLGIEVNTAARKEASLKTGIDTVSSVADVPDGWADVLISNHALEQAQTPYETLVALRSKVKPGGVAVFVVPHEGPHQEYHPGDVNNHLYTWNPMTLGNLFAAAGFRVDRVEALQHQWPPDYEALFARVGEAEFHRACERWARQNGNFQIRIVATVAAEQPQASREDWSPAGQKAETTFIPGGRNAGAAELPVAVVVYNRPQHAERVLEGLRNLGAKNVTLFSDGPRGAQDAEAVAATRRVIAAIDWTAPHVVERSENVGLARAVREAMDRLLLQNDCAILLEDDCVPQPGFFEFMHRALERYRDDERVFGVSGYSVLLPEPLRRSYPFDAYFVPRIGSWGWGTWRRAWQLLDPDLNRLWQSVQAHGIDAEQAGTDIPFMVELFLRGEIKDVWTLNWVLTVYLNRGQFLYPTASLIDNIGMDGTGIHCGSTAQFQTRMAAAPLTRFPHSIATDPRILAAFRSYYDRIQPAAVSR